MGARTNRHPGKVAPLNALKEPAMLIQILTHTPIYVWAILAFLVQRGMIAMRDRDVELRKLVMIPAVMLVLSLQDMNAKFGLGGPALAAWALAAAAMALPAGLAGTGRIGASNVPGSVRVRGSRLPLVMMMAVFFTKYVASVALSVAPQLRHDTLFACAVCGLFGVFNGWFVGRLARDLASYRLLPAGAAAA
ncbi:DUF6622 family protein [Massilia sp. Root335]|uniref:DUF6622 family protein n=1 Tax=Massilia sp. Root335 TaxID=1736517 RepID=UPI0027D88167|nr:DUF6622 family protein [Massilia sp. Root335]